MEDGNIEHDTVEQYNKTNPDLSNVENCALDSEEAIREAYESQFINYTEFIKKLKACQARIPPIYQESIYHPFLRILQSMGRDEFDHIARDPGRSYERHVMTEISEAIFQNWGEPASMRSSIEGPATDNVTVTDTTTKNSLDAFHEVVSDLYEGFLSAAVRANVKPPDMRAVVPIVKWGGTGPYTLLLGAASIFSVRTSIISLPRSSARHGLFTWATLAHETAGHDIIPSDIGLPGELAKALWDALTAEDLDPVIAGYWVRRLDEAASDVLGILSMGPASGIAGVVYLRGMRAAEARSIRPALSNLGPAVDPHPADILRGYLAASTVSLLQFDDAEKWANAIWAETDRDLGQVFLGWTEVSPQDARSSSIIVARTVARSKMRSLEGHALGEIQNWDNEDEAIVKDFRQYLRGEAEAPERYGPGIYAAHAVAGAVLEALSERADLELIFERMLLALKSMHDQNPRYGNASFDTSSHL